MDLDSHLEGVNVFISLLKLNDFDILPITYYMSSTPLLFRHIISFVSIAFTYIKQEYIVEYLKYYSMQIFAKRLLHMSMHNDIVPPYYPLENRLQYQSLTSF